MLPRLQSEAPDCSNEQKPKHWCPFLWFIWHVRFRRVNSWREHWWAAHWMLKSSWALCCLTAFPAELFPEMHFTGLRISENREDVRNTRRNQNQHFSFLLKSITLLTNKYKENFWAKTTGFLSENLHTVCWRVQWCTELPGEQESSAWLWLTLLAAASSELFQGVGKVNQSRNGGRKQRQKSDTSHSILRPGRFLLWSWGNM